MCCSLRFRMRVFRAETLTAWHTWILIYILVMNEPDIIGVSRGDNIEIKDQKRLFTNSLTWWLIDRRNIFFLMIAFVIPIFTNLCIVEIAIRIRWPIYSINSMQCDQMRLRHTFIAIKTLVSNSAFTRIFQPIINACRAIQAWVGCAVVNIYKENYIFLTKNVLVQHMSHISIIVLDYRQKQLQNKYSNVTQNKLTCDKIIASLVRPSIELNWR